MGRRQSGDPAAVAHNHVFARGSKMLRESNVGSAAAPSQCHGRSVSDGPTLCPGAVPRGSKEVVVGRWSAWLLADARYGWAPTSRAPGLATLAVPPCWYDVCALMRLSELVDTS